MSDRSMNSNPHPNLAAIERRLERRAPADPPTALRHRILEMVPATKSRQSAQDDSLSSPYLVAGTILVLAMSVLLPLVAMAVASPRPDGSPPRTLAFVERARLAGITIETTSSSPRGPGPSVTAPAGRLRAIDARALVERTLLQGDL